MAVALGHASDDLAPGRVADTRFATPTAFGVWLRGVVEEKRARRVKVGEAEQLLRSQAVLDQLRDLRASIRSCRLTAVAAVIARVAVVLWHFLVRS